MLFIELEYLLITIFFYNMDLEFLLSDKKYRNGTWRCGNSYIELLNVYLR